MSDTHDEHHTDVLKYSDTISSILDRSLQWVPAIKQCLAASSDSEPSPDEGIETLTLERDQLLEEVYQSQRIVDLQLHTISILNKQQNSLLHTISKYKKKAAARLESAASLGKRIPEEPPQTRDFSAQVSSNTTDTGTQCFDYLNEHEDYASNVKAKEGAYIDKIEECFKLLLVARYGAGSMMIGRKRQQSNQNSHKKDRSAQRVDLQSESAVEDEGSLVFDGNLSPNLSDRDVYETKAGVSGKDNRHSKMT